MTVSELIQYFGDGDMFPDPKQEVKFALCKDGATHSVNLDISSTTVPVEGDVVVELKPAPKKKYKFSLRLEANPVIEAESFEEAERKAYDIMRRCVVFNQVTGKEDNSYCAQEPCLLEEVE